jgi:hypothetical protein
MDSKTHSIDRFYSTDLLHHQSTSNRKMLAGDFLPEGVWGHYCSYLKTLGTSFHPVTGGDFTIVRTLSENRSIATFHSLTETTARNKILNRGDLPGYRIKMTLSLALDPWNRAKEPFCIGMLRVRKEFHYRSPLNNPPSIHYDHLITVLGDHSKIMSDHQNSHPKLLLH